MSSDSADTGPGEDAVRRYLSRGNSDEQVDRIIHSLSAENYHHFTEPGYERRLGEIAANDPRPDRYKEYAEHFCEAVRGLLDTWQRIISSPEAADELKASAYGVAQSVVRYHAFDAHKHKYKITIPEGVRAQKSIEMKVTDTNPGEFYATEVRFCGEKDDERFQIDFYDSNSDFWLSVFEPRLDIEPVFPTDQHEENNPEGSGQL